MRKLMSLAVTIGLVSTCLMPQIIAATPEELGTKYENLDASLWDLVWSDEFAGTEIDTSKWTFTIGGGGFGNNEQQYYTNQAQNASLQDGMLVLNAIQGAYGGENYTSAKLSSTQSWTYGKYEFRAKLPAGTGLWPAIWMLPSNMDKYGGQWPICGEIDIMEYMGSDTDTVLGTLHYGNPWVYNTGYYNLQEGQSFSDDFHTFTLEWLPGEMRWYVDGTLYQIQQDWYSINTDGTQNAYPAPFDQNFYLMLNLAVGGFFPGDPVPSTWTNTQFVVDYVRVYEYTGNLTEAETAPQTPGVNLLENSDFSQGLTGWSTWSENGALFTAADGVLSAQLFTTQPNTWSSQLYQNVPVYTGTNYRLSFQARSTAARPITVGIENPNHATLFNETIPLGSEWQTYTFDFTPTMSSQNGKLLFFLGAISGSSDVAHTIYFDNVTLIPIASSAQSLVQNGDFSNELNSWTTWTENGSAYQYNAAEGCFVATIPTTLPNAWSAQLYQNVSFAQSGTYTLSFDVKSSMERQICVALEKEYITPLLSEITSITSDWSTITYQFSASSMQDVKLVFMLGNVGTTQNAAHTVSIDNIQLTQIA